MVRQPLFNNVIDSSPFPALRWAYSSRFAALLAVCQKFPIVKDTTPQTHAYITSRTLNFGGTSHETTDFL